MAEIEMPQLGETVTEGTITRWFKQVGDTISVDEVLFEVSTDKVDTEVPSPVAGTITEIRVPEGDTVEVGEVLAVVGDGAPQAAGEPAAPAAAESQAAAPPAESAPPPPPPPPPPPAPEAAAPPPPPPAPEAPPAPISEPATATASHAGSNTEGKLLSPVVRRLINTYAIDADKITGTGLGGRISRDDVQRYIESNQLKPASASESAGAAPPPPRPDAPASGSPAPTQAPAPAPAPAPARVVEAPITTAGAGDTVIPLSNIRLRTGEHMVMSKAVAPHTLTAIEIDYEAVEQIRKAHGSEFKASEGFSLTYLPFISRAVIDALREYPHLNASISEGQLILHRSVNLAVAVDLDFQGLLAPVVPGADGLRMRSIARGIADVARRARAKQLKPDELAGGTFTLTNAGSYGTMMQFPIINQPQVAILSTDAVNRKPVVIEDNFGNESIVVHSVGILAMAWDHRAIDGAYAAAFLARVKDIIENRDWADELA